MRNKDVHRLRIGALVVFSLFLHLRRRDAHALRKGAKDTIENLILQVFGEVASVMWRVRAEQSSILLNFFTSFDVGCPCSREQRAVRQVLGSVVA